MTKDILKTVYFVRHGQSEGNLGLVFQGAESPLSDKGRLQAKQVAMRVSKLNFDALVASSYTRARQTAEAIAEATGKSVTFSDLFIERRRPSSSAEKSRQDAEAVEVEERWLESLFDAEMRVEDGENYSDLLARSDAALAYLEAIPEQRIVVVTHGYFLQTLLARVLLGQTITPAALRSFQQHIGHENTGITALVNEVRHDKAGWGLWIFNDHAHLAE